jgi:hypothetical protein
MFNVDELVKSRRTPPNVIPVGRFIGFQREPLRKLGNSASGWRPLGELGKAERIERPDLY